MVETDLESVRTETVIADVIELDLEIVLEGIGSGILRPRIGSEDELFFKNPRIGYVHVHVRQDDMKESPMKNDST